LFLNNLSSVSGDCGGGGGGGGDASIIFCLYNKYKYNINIK
jgi:hypothetical protein